MDHQGAKAGATARKVVMLSASADFQTEITESHSLWHRDTE